MKNSRKKVTVIIAATAAAAIVLGMALYLAPYTAEPLDFSADEGGDGANARVMMDNGDMLILPGTTARAGLVFYTGARVPPEAYAAMLTPLAEAGIAVYVPRLPFNFAIFDVNAAAKAMASAPELPVWYIGGHSLGGAAAAMYADAHRDGLAGIVFLASYPGGGTDLSDWGGRVLSVEAGEDGLATAAKLEAARGLLPADSAIVRLEGGNHAGFGRYGEQKGDGEASMPRAEQEARTAAAIKAFILGETNEEAAP